MTTSALPAVAAVILSYKDPQATLRCAASLRRSSYPGLTTLIVDNASGPATEAALRRDPGGCTLLFTEKNLGFGGGCNRGIEAARAANAAYILLLNQDTVVAPDMVELLVAFMETHPAAGVVGPRTFFGEPAARAEQKLLYAGAWRGRLPLRQKVPGIDRTDSRPAPSPVRTDYVWGHGMMLRSAALAAAGAFDPAFFMYYEDLDLCRRLSRAGYEIWCEPRAVMWHDIEDGARAGSSEFWRWACKMHSTALFHRKHFGRLPGAALSFLTVGAEAQLLFRQGHFRALGHLLLAYGRSLLGGGPVRPPSKPEESSHG